MADKAAVCNFCKYYHPVGTDRGRGICEITSNIVAAECSVWLYGFYCNNSYKENKELTTRLGWDNSKLIKLSGDRSWLCKCEKCGYVFRTHSCLPHWYCDNCFRRFDFSEVKSVVFKELQDYLSKIDEFDTYRWMDEIAKRDRLRRYEPEEMDK